MWNGGIYGSCPDAYASSLRAELWGVLGILRYAVAPLAIGVDNAEVITGWSSGKAYCGNPKREGADLWRKIWDILGDIGEKGVVLFKVKAHLMVEDAEAGIISLQDWRGNCAADRMAVKGAMLAERRAPREGGDNQLKRALRFYRWAAEMAADWREDTDRGRVGAGGAGTGGESEVASARSKRTPPVVPLHPVSPHIWWQRMRGGLAGGTIMQKMRP